MRRLILILIVVLGVQGSVSADNRSKELLRSLHNAVEALGDYRVDFDVEIEESRIKGYYSVSGSSYYMKIGDAEVYSDGDVRYEVDHQKREVVIDSVNPDSRNILNNPTKVFSSLDRDFLSEVLSESGSEIKILLMPANKSVGISRVTLILNSRDAMPKRVIYNEDSEPIEITIRSFTSEQEPMLKFDAKLYSEYEQIDFR